MAEELSVASFVIPTPKRVVFGATLFTAFLVFLVALAIWNLTQGNALIASCLWLGLIGFILGGYIKSEGYRKVAVYVLGAFSTRNFAWAYQLPPKTTEIRFGYEIFGFRHFHLSVPVDRIKSVNWHTGQASYFAKKDVGDWSVALWYDHGDPVKSRAQKNMRNPDQEVYIVGLEGSKNKVSAFGRELLNFLREAGVTLVQGKDDCEYVRQPDTP